MFASWSQWCYPSQPMQRIQAINEFLILILNNYYKIGNIIISYHNVDIINPMCMYTSINNNTTGTGQLMWY